MSKKRPPNYERTLKHQLGEALDTARNAASAAQAARKQRDEAQAELAEIRETMKARIANLENQLGAEQRQRAAISQALQDRIKRIRDLFATIFNLHVEIGRKDGYITRVRERDNPSGPESTQEPNADPGALRESLARAVGESAVASILDSVDSDTLDQVLGRNPDQGFERTQF